MKITELIEKRKRPVRILQFGEGNFLRAFIEEFVQETNEAGVYNGSVCVVKPRAGGEVTSFRQQKCMYTLITQGLKGGKPFRNKKIITCIDAILHGTEDYRVFLKTAQQPEIQVIVSNTTEAGICINERDELSGPPPEAYPGKLTQWMYERFLYFGGAPEKGLLVLPLELNEANGTLLKKAVLAYIKLWGLPENFKNWVQECNLFCNTLVDRIVSGYSKEEMHYEDKFIDICEPYCFFAIEAQDKEQVEKKFSIAGNHPRIVLTDDLSLYRERKVKILNGIHTSVSLAAYHAGYQYVREFMEDEIFLSWIKQMIWQEIIPTIHMERDVLSAYALEIMQRFQNPFLDHRLLDIAMNSVKKWQVRILPTIMQYEKITGAMPKGLVFSLASLLFFYKAGAEGGYPLKDEKRVIESISPTTSPAEFLQNTGLWGENTFFMKKLTSATEENLNLIQEKGIKEAIKRVCRQ